MAILAALDTYHGAFSRLPENVSKACDEVAELSAKNASEQAQAKMNTAVALLVPTVEKAVEEAARHTVERIQIGHSLYSIFLGLASLGFMFVFGWICGAHLFTQYQLGNMTAVYFWSQTWSGLGLGVAGSALLIYGITYRSINVWNRDADGVWTWRQVGLIFLGAAILLALGLHQFGVFGTTK